EPEALHQTRVGLRRLRSAMTVFKGAVDDPTGRLLKVRLKEMFAALGEARELDVFVEERMPEFVARLDRAALTELRRRLQTHRARAYERARVALREAEEEGLFKSCTEWIEGRSWSAAGARGGAAGPDRLLADFARH